MKTGKPNFGFFDTAEAANLYDPGEPRAREPYTAYPRLGESLGPRTGGLRHASGSLGLFVTLTAADGAPRPFGLTCRHVAFPPVIRPLPGL